MKFKTPITELIRRRHSQRKYRSGEIPEELMRQLREGLSAAPAGPFGGRIRLETLRARDAGLGRKAEVAKLGTYGMIRGAEHFMVGLVQPNEHAMEDFGYVFEWAILLVTDLGLNSCWLGGTFQRHAFAEAAQSQVGEIVPAVTPLGFASEKPGLIDSVVRFAAGSKKRKPWNELFFEERVSTPLTEAVAGLAAIPLEMVRLAPSASNRQPWRVVFNKGQRRFDFYLQRTPRYDTLTTVDLQKIDMGIAFCHFELAAREVGLPGHFEKVVGALDLAPEKMQYVSSWMD